MNYICIDAMLFSCIYFHSFSFYPITSFRGKFLRRPHPFCVDDYTIDVFFSRFFLYIVFFLYTNDFSIYVILFLKVNIFFTL